MMGGSITRDFVEIVVMLEIKGIALLFCYTIILMVVRQKTLIAETHYRAYYGEQIMREIMGEPGSPLIQMPGPNSFIRRRVLREVILNHLGFITGTERAKMVETYQRLGYLMIDLKHLSSWRWSQRLEALARLRALEITHVAPILDHMRDDPNDFVKMAAFLALSAVDHELNSAALLEILPEFVLLRSNVLVEIASNIGQLRGYQGLAIFLASRYSLALREGVVVAMSATNSPDNAFIALKVLSERPPKVLTCRILEYLQKIGDPDHARVIEPLFAHPDPDVRAAAVRWFLAIKGSDSVVIATALREDRSVEVQRTLAQHGLRVAA